MKKMDHTLKNKSPVLKKWQATAIYIEPLRRALAQETYSIDKLDKVYVNGLYIITTQ